MAALFYFKGSENMKEISNALSDAIFTVCNKIISNAKFDKTYKCRVVSKVSDGKYIVIKDDVEHVVNSAFLYNVGDIVTVLLPQNSWKNATIVYPQDNLNETIKYVNDNAVKLYQNQSGRGIMNDVCTFRSADYANTGTIKISVPFVLMSNLYIDVWSYEYRGLYIASGYTYDKTHEWFKPQAMCLTTKDKVLPIRFAEDNDKNKYILLGTTTTNHGGYLGVSVMKMYSNYSAIDYSSDVTIEFITDESDLKITATF